MTQIYNARRAMINVRKLNARFLSHYRTTGRAFNDATDYEVSIGVKNPSGPVWRLIGVHHLSGSENMGNHHAYCEVLDSDGKRMNGSVLEMRQGNQAPVTATIDKPSNEAGTNFPVWGASPCTIKVIGGRGAFGRYASDRVSGIRINWKGDSEGNSIGHNSFYCAWQLLAVSVLPPAIEPKPKPEPEPERPMPPGVGAGAIRCALISLDQMSYTVGGFISELEIATILADEHDDRGGVNVTLILEDNSSASFIHRGRYTILLAAS
jgi:hypothetical protein